MLCGINYAVTHVCTGTAITAVAGTASYDSTEVTKYIIQHGDLHCATSCAHLLTLSKHLAQTKVNEFYY
jgi:hypothetical protein